MNPVSLHLESFLRCYTNQLPMIEFTSLFKIEKNGHFDIYQKPIDMNL